MSVKPAPIKFQKTFNTNNYFKDGSALLNSGNQRLHGSLQTTGSNITYGDETVFGDSTLKDEPLIISITDPLLLQSNHLVSKSYVDSKITSSYPQIYTFGRAVKIGPDNPDFMENLTNYFYVRFQNTEEVIQSLYVEVIYDIQRGKRYTLERNSAIQRRSVYNIVFYKSNYLTFDTSTIELIGGDNLTSSLGSNPSYTPFSVGTENGNCKIRYEFPPSTYYIHEADNWIETYGISVRILKSNGINNFGSVNETSGNAYFASD